MKQHKVAHPFAGLLGLAPPTRLPLSASTTLVLCGRKVNAAADVRQLVADDTDEAREMLRLLTRVRLQARWQREKHDPQVIETRAQQDAARREAKREYLRRYRAEHSDRLRKKAAEYARLCYHADPEAARQRNREARARAKQRKAAAAGAES